MLLCDRTLVVSAMLLALAGHFSRLRSGRSSIGATPIGINFEDNTDEYEPNRETILPRLRNCHSEGDVLQVVHAEFVRWFDPATAGPPEHYEKIAKDVWQLWQRHLASRP